MADWNAELPGKAEAGNPGHPDDHNLIVAAIREVRDNIDEIPKGDKGDPGSDGLSAFEVAQSEGFEGTVTEWLASLKGDPGADGKDGAKGDPGADGADGFGTEEQYNDIISRLEALEAAGDAGEGEAGAGE